MSEQGKNYKEYFVPTLWILLNPYNLLALYFAKNGLAMWGVGTSYRINYSTLTLFKIFGIPTLVFALSWLGVRKWIKISYWKTYINSFVISLILIDTTLNIYWKFIKRS